MQNWNKETWKLLEAKQQPLWEDQNELIDVKKQLSELPPLVFSDEIRRLKKQLAKVSDGEAFLLQCGDCAESFQDCNSIKIREQLKLILQMSIVLTYAGEKPVVKVGRIAGQYAKPRSKPTELINGSHYPSYRGDMVNSDSLNEDARKNRGHNMLKGYFRSAATLNLLRSFTKGGFASLKNIHKWNLEFVEKSHLGQQYERLSQDIDKTLKFINVIGLDHPKINEVHFYTSHEALLLDYEEPLIRQDSINGGFFDCSAHMLWIGDRTRQLDGAHIEFLRGVENPLGIKIGPKHDIDELLQIIDRLNPENEKGRLTLITRMGKDTIEDMLPGLVERVTKEGKNIVWSCDPMHANTYQEGDYKTRHFDAIFSEIKSFFRIHQSLGTVAGGIHLETTGMNVTECLGGAQNISTERLSDHYETLCDPRLNAEQGLELAFKIADFIKN